MNLVDTLKRWGLTVVEIDGWQTRGWTVNKYGQKWAPRGLVAHHTANGGFRGIDAPSLNVCINGRPDLAGPLCQIVLGYSGTVYLIAGLGANHAGSGGWGTLQGNGSVWGIEAENNGVGEPWPAVQLDAYYRTSAALAEYTGFAPGSICGHKEWTRTKIDPAGIDMNDFRRRVATLLEEGPAPTPTLKGSPDMISTTKLNDGRLVEFRAAVGTVLHRWQGVPNGGYGEYKSLGNKSLPEKVNSVEASTNADGRMEVRAWNSEVENPQTYIAVQNADTTWREWAKF